MKRENEMKKVSKDEKQMHNNKMNTIAKLLLIMFAVVLLILIILIIIGGVYFNKEKEKIISQNLKAISKDEIIIEYGEKLSYETILNKVLRTEDLYEGTNIKIKINGKNIEPNDEYVVNSIGELKINIDTNNKLFNVNISNDTEIIWIVEDTQKPILSGVRNRTIEEGEKINLEEGITAKDSVDGELEVTIEGKFNNKKAGKYTLKAKAIDSNNNEVEQTFTVTT